MNLKLNPQKLGAWVLRLVALAGVVVGSVNPASLPTSLRATFVVVSGVVLAVDRYLTDPSTGTPQKPSQPPASPAP